MSLHTYGQSDIYIAHPTSTPFLWSLRPDWWLGLEFGVWFSETAGALKLEKKSQCIGHVLL